VVEAILSWILDNRYCGLKYHFWSINRNDVVILPRIPWREHASLQMRLVMSWLAYSATFHAVEGANHTPEDRSSVHLICRF
jgi:hypothetical protein